MKKALRFLLTAAVAATWCCATTDTSVVSVESPRICAHRGGRHEYDDNAVGGFVASLKAGIRVAMWMINTKEEYELAKSLGADTVTSDYPVRLLNELKK